MNYVNHFDIGKSKMIYEQVWAYCWRGSRLNPCACAIKIKLLKTLNRFHTQKFSLIDDFQSTKCIQ